MGSYGTQSGSNMSQGVQESTSTTRQGAQSTTTPSPLLEPAAKSILTAINPVQTEFLQQLFEGLRTGGIGAQVPIITKAVEESRRAASGTEQQLGTEQARTGQAGTPFGTAQMATAQRENAFKTSQIGPNYVASLLQTLPQLIAQLSQTAVSGLGQAARTESTSSLASDAYSWANSYATGEYTGQNRDSGVQMQCCFIFLAADGYLHPCVRAYRDSHMTVRSVRGYYWLSDRLVPAMRSRRWLRLLVRLTMTRPLTSYGKAFYGSKRRGFVFAPVVTAWRAVFRLVSPSAPYTRRGTKEVI